MSQAELKQKAIKLLESKLKKDESPLKEKENKSEEVIQKKTRENTIKVSEYKQDQNISPLKVKSSEIEDLMPKELDKKKAEFWEIAEESTFATVEFDDHFLLREKELRAQREKLKKELSMLENSQILVKKSRF